MATNFIRILFIGSLLFLSETAIAQQVNLQKNHDSAQPIKITADNLEVQQDVHIAIFTGNVVAVQGDTTLKSEIMKVHYRSKEDDEATPGNKPKPAKAPAPKKPENSPSAAGPANSSISLIEVEKNVFMTAPDESAQGDNGTYDVDNHIIKLNNHVILVKNKNIIKGDRLVYDTESGKSQVFSNNDNGKTNGRVESVFVPSKPINPNAGADNKPKQDMKNDATEQQ